MINDNQIPFHVAIIPDGNRRWAKKRGMEPWKGHEAGAEVIEQMIKTSLKKGVSCLSFWGSSMDNLIKRPLAEKRALLDIYYRYFKRLLEDDELHKNETQVNFIGRWEEQFPESLKKVLYEIINKTKQYKKRMLNFMLAYSGTDDVIQAVEKINQKFAGKAKISAEIFKENLMTAAIPPVDFMIRTGGEPHNSNGFMMWDTANSQLYFSQELFPDFNEEKFSVALDEYAARGRRFGK